MLEPKLIKPAEGQDVLARVQCCANMAIWLPDGSEFSQSYCLPKSIYIYININTYILSSPTTRTVMKVKLFLILCLVNTRSIKRFKGTTQKHPPEYLIATVDRVSKGPRLFGGSCGIN